MKHSMLSAVLISMLIVPAAGFSAERAQDSAVTAAGQDSHKLAGERPLGLGLIIGEPTGISGKYWLSPSNAIDFAAAWSFANDDDFHLHADYLVHLNNAFQVGEAPIHFYYGIGARFKTEKDKRFGARIPVGLEFIPRGAPIELFVEIAPILDMIPDTSFRMNSALGARHFF